MIDINKLRQLAQAATPGPWVSQGRYIGTPRHMSYIGEVRDQCGNWSDTEKSRADAAFISAANPAVMIELLDRLEEAEFDALEQARLNGMGSEREAALMAKLEAAERERDECNRRRLEAADHFAAQTALMKKKCDDLRAKIEEMEKQEPAGYGVRYVEPTNGEEDWDSIWKYRVFAEDHIKDFTQAYADVGEPVGAITVTPLYTLPGAQPAPSGWLQHAARMATLARKLREPDWHLESIREMQRELRMLEESALATAQREST